MTVSLSNSAAKYLARMNDPDLSRVVTALAGLALEPPQGDILPITGQPGYFRLKVGGYRVLYKIGNDAICVTHIARRGQAYTKKTRST